MKKIILAGLMALALASTAAFAAQNKNTKPASKPAMTGNKTATGGGGGKRHHRRHHRKHHKGGKGTGNMASTPKPTNSNKKK